MKRSCLLLFLVLMLVSIGQANSAETNDLDKQLYAKSRAFLSSALKEVTNARSTWTKRFVGKLKNMQSVGDEYKMMLIPKVVLLASLKDAEKNLNLYMNWIAAYRDWMDTRDVSRRDLFRKNAPVAVSRAAEVLWTVSLKETSYDVVLLEQEFDGAPIFKEYNNKQDLADKKSYDEREATLKALKAAYGPKELILRKEIVEQYEQITKRLSDRRRRQGAATWDWANFFHKRKNEAAATEMARQVYNLFCADIGARSKDLRKRLNLGGNSELEFFYDFPFSEDRLILGSGKILKDQKSLYEMNAALLAEKVEDFGSIDAGSKLIWFSVGPIHVDGLAWYPNRLQPKNKIQAIEDERQQAQKQRADAVAAVKTLSRKRSTLRREAREKEVAFKKAVADMNELLKLTDLQKRYQAIADTAQQEIDKLEVDLSGEQEVLKTLDEQLDPDKFKEAQKIIEDLKQRIEVNKDSRERSLAIIKNARGSTKILGRAYKDRITKMRSELFDLRYKFDIADRDLPLETQYVEKYAEQIRILSDTLAPLKKEDARLDAIKSRFDHEGILARKITLFASDGREIFHAVHWTPGKALAQLETEIEAARKALKLAKEVRDKVIANSNAALQESKDQGAKVSGAIMRSAYGQASVEGAKFLYEVYEKWKDAGPFGALVEAVHKLITSSPPVTLADEDKIYKEVEAEINSKIRSNRQPMLPGYDFYKKRVRKEVFDKRIKGMAYKSSVASWVQRSIARNSELNLNTFIAKDKSALGFVKGLEKRTDALLKANNQMEKLAKGFPLNKETLFKGLLKGFARDAAKFVAKEFFKNVEYKAWRNYYIADFKSRAMSVISVKAKGLYQDAQSRLKTLLEARRDLLKGYNPESGFRIDLTRRFEEGETLRIVLDLPAEMDDLEVSLGGEIASPKGGATFVLETRFARSGKKGALPLAVRFKKK